MCIETNLSRVSTHVAQRDSQVPATAHRLFNKHACLFPTCRVGGTPNAAADVWSRALAPPRTEAAACCAGASSPGAACMPEQTAAESEDQSLISAVPETHAA